jgi:hypothetical protein
MVGAIRVSAFRGRQSELHGWPLVSNLAMRLRQPKAGADCRHLKARADQWLRAAQLLPD